jgi:hypothetical protein
MDFPGLPDDLADLERSLVERRRPEPAVGFRSRVLAAMAPELTGLRRRRWQLAIAGGMAAAVLVAAFLAWNRNRQGPPTERAGVDTLAAFQATEPDDALLTWGSHRRALDRSPEGWEELLDKKWSEKRTRAAPPQVLSRADSESLHLNGEFQ